MFTVRGRLEGAPVEVIWSEEVAGRLGGDAAAIARVEELVTAGERVKATPTGPTYTAGIEPDHVALVTIVDTLDAIEEIVGDVPEIPGVAIPKGAVA